jgi:glycerol-3-phosphate dehydrogenase
MLKLGAGLTLYDLLATGAQPVARHRKLSAKALRAYYPFLRQEGLVGGFTYGDCQEDDARMTLAVVAAAQAAGAVCVNRMQATQLRRDGQEVLGVETLDELTHHAGVISARHTIMAAGPWLSDLLGEAAPKVKLIKGVHLLMPAIPDNDEAFLLTAPQDGRVFFVIPWYGKTLVGTTESRVNHVDEAQVLPEDVDYLLAAANANLPGLDWRKDHVLSAFAGVRTLQDDSQNGQGSLSATSREFDVVQPYQNLLVLLGGKYTTSRVDAAKVIDQLYKLRDQPVVPSRTHAVPLPDAPPWQHFDDWLAHEIQQLQALGVESEAARWVALRHGTRTHRVAEIIQENPTWAARIHPEAPFIRAEALVAVRDEMAMNPDDVFRRRMPLSLLVPDLHLVRGQMEPLLTLAWTRQSWGLAGA